MHALVRQVFVFFSRMGGTGLVGFGILDSSFLFLPLGNDLLLIALTARHPKWFWYYALMAALGSLIGCALTDLVSRKLGEAGIERFARPERMHKLRERIKKHIWWVLGGAAMLPPPFPFTIFVIAASGMQVSRWRVLSAIGVGRLVRFFVLGLLAVRYGRHILRIAERPEVEYMVIGLAVISIVGSVFSVMKWVRKPHPRPSPSGVPAA